jgi:hypothetical protein
MENDSFKNPVAAALRADLKYFLSLWMYHAEMREALRKGFAGDLLTRPHTGYLGHMPDGEVHPTVTIPDSTHSAWIATDDAESDIRWDASRYT